MKIKEPSFEEIYHVAKHLRPEDRTELALTRPDMDPLMLAIDAWLAEYAWVALTGDGEPAMVFGWHRFQGVAAQLWAFATDRDRAVLAGVTKHIIRVIVPAFPALGIIRTFCFIQPENHRFIRWLTFLGLEPEATISDLGAGRQGSLILYARSHDAGDHSSQSRSQEPAQPRHCAGGLQ
jgi:hypothetical protein